MLAHWHQGTVNRKISFLDFNIHIQKVVHVYHVSLIKPHPHEDIWEYVYGCVSIGDKAR